MPHVPDPPHLSDAYRRLREIGFNQAVFEFLYTTKDGECADLAPERARVLVRNTENNSKRIYDAAPGEPWTVRFAADVRNGVYGDPPRGATTKMSL